MNQATKYKVRCHLVPPSVLVGEMMLGCGAVLQRPLQHKRTCLPPAPNHGSPISARPLPFPEGRRGKSEMPCRNTMKVARGSWINSYLFNWWKEASETHVKNLVYPYIKIQTFQHEISILKWIVRCSACWLAGFILKPCAACAQHFSTWTSHVWRVQKPHDQEEAQNHLGRKWTWMWSAGSRRESENSEGKGGEEPPTPQHCVRCFHKGWLTPPPAHGGEACFFPSHTRISVCVCERETHGWNNECVVPGSMCCVWGRFWSLWGWWVHSM